jgi:hypothetical protein
MDEVEKRNSRSYRDSSSDPSVIQPVASRYTDYAIPGPWEQNVSSIKELQGNL